MPAAILSALYEDLVPMGILSPADAHALTRAGEMVKNDGAAGDGDNAWAVGGALGELKAKGDWMLY